jgi:hypothetical protein
MNAKARRTRPSSRNSTAPSPGSTRRRWSRCYAPDAHFSDAVFTDLKGDQIFAMWRMLAKRAKGFTLTFRDVAADEATGRAHWEAQTISILEDRAPGAQRHRRELRLRRREDRGAPGPLRPVAVGGNGARGAGEAARVDADDEGEDPGDGEGRGWRSSCGRRQRPSRTHRWVNRREADRGWQQSRCSRRRGPRRARACVRWPRRPDAADRFVRG